MNELKKNKDHLSYEDYLQIVDDQLGGLFPNEDTEIIVYMYESDWTVKECIDHIKSIRDFNKKLDRI